MYSNHRERPYLGTLLLLHWMKIKTIRILDNNETVRTSIISNPKSSCLFDYLLLFLGNEPCRYDRNRFRKENKAIAQEYKELLLVTKP
jgi:hypothetical protein